VNHSRAVSREQLPAIGPEPRVGPEQGKVARLAAQIAQLQAVLEVQQEAPVASKQQRAVPQVVVNPVDCLLFLAGAGVEEADEQRPLSGMSGIDQPAAVGTERDVENAGMVVLKREQLLVAANILVHDGRKRVSMSGKNSPASQSRGILTHVTP
jgi:hypothetical protein